MKLLYIIIFSLLFQIKAISQYKHRLELNPGVGYININDSKFVRVGETLLLHETHHTGLGLNISLSYQLTDLPALLTVNLSTYRARNPDYNPNLYFTISQLSQINLNSIDFSGEWYFFSKQALQSLYRCRCYFHKFQCK